MPRRSTPLLRLLLLACTVALTVPTVAVPASAALTSAPSAAASPAQRPQPNPNRPAQAQAALDRVEQLLAGVGPATNQGGRRDLTLALRDLFALKDALGPADRARAERLLARPDDPATCGNDAACYDRPAEVKTTCNDTACVHYALRADDPANGVPGEDDGVGGEWRGAGTSANGVPDYADYALAQTTHVHQTYVDAGYRAPVPDGTEGGSDLPDIYLLEIGSLGLYGYCAPERRAAPGSKAASGYCVFDDDYSRREFPSNTPAQNLQVTAAHEYFHDVQFGYDAFEDRWLMEATATWAEDEVYDNVNDNVFYLSHGPIPNPDIPLDSFTGLFHYGTWIFFRHLTEQYPAQTGALPKLVLDVWKLLDGIDATKPDLYSRAGSQAGPRRAEHDAAPAARDLRAVQPPPEDLVRRSARPALPERTSRRHGAADPRGAVQEDGVQARPPDQQHLQVRPRGRHGCEVAAATEVQDQRGGPRWVRRRRDQAEGRADRLPPVRARRQGHRDAHAAVQRPLGEVDRGDGGQREHPLQLQRADQLQLPRQAARRQPHPGDRRQGVQALTCLSRPGERDRRVTLTGTTASQSRAAAASRASALRATAGSVVVHIGGRLALRNAP